MGQQKTNMTRKSDHDVSGNKPNAPEALETMTAIQQCSLIQHTNMGNTLRTPQVRTVLERLFAAAAQDEETPRWREPGLSWETATAQERAEASESTYMSISPEGGDLLYILARAKRPNTVIEFGTSYGISTIYLAAAVADNGTGRVVSTELSEAKVLAARANLEEARLADRVTILLGDAMTTLNGIPGPIDLVVLDGWKDLYLPVLRSLESRLTIGALIVADDINLPSLSAYLEYVRHPANGYVSVAFPVEDGMEISCWTADGRFDEKGAS
jgi:predicted O-methyltransferase YrrM